MDFDHFAYPDPLNPIPAESQSLFRFGVDETGAGEAERFALYNYYYNDGSSVFGGDLKWGIGAATAFDNLNGGAALPLGISGFLTNFTVPDGTDGFSLLLDLITIDEYRFRIVEDGVTKVDVSGNLDTDTAGQGISALTLWSVGGNIDSGTPTSYFDNLQIAATPTDGIDGDYNDNGTVDAADYVLWRDTLNQMGSNLPADGNDNNMIDQGDYDVWRAHFGQSDGARFFQNGSVPEPTTATLFLFILLTSVSFQCRFVRKKVGCE
jgi:hypothetical protein